ncbi:MAG: glycosyl hydrolase [Bacteroidales bacterium]|nr:glycosyl hydrolase [Bacteroidales bacterium]
MLKKTPPILIIIIAITLACNSNADKTTSNATSENIKNKNAMYQDTLTQILYKNLKNLSETGKIMFGMANPTTIGYTKGPKNNDIEQSDCKDITGSHPAFHESDFMWYQEDPSFKEYDLKAMKKAYGRGAVCGYCWHFRGMRSNEFYAKKDGKYTDDKDLVKAILASPDRNTNKALDWFLLQIDTLLIPVFKELGFPLVFRPFHEMNGNWFWWGSDNCTPQEYIKLFRLTVDYLREKGVNNLLYAWSLNVDATFEYYPGDGYVDILGLDSYEPGIAPWNSEEKFIKTLQALTDSAFSKGKIAALTETGCRKDNELFRYVDQYPDYWTKHVLNPIINDKKAKRIVWILSWYSGDWDHDLSGQYYIPYKGIDRPNSKKGLDDFIKFYNAPETLFEDDLPDMYHK